MVRPLKRSSLHSPEGSTRRAANTRAPRRGLVAHAEPAVALVVAVEGLGRERVREGEEVRALAALGLQRELAVQELVVQHRLHALARHIPARARTGACSPPHPAGDPAPGSG